MELLPIRFDLPRGIHPVQSNLSRDHLPVLGLGAPFGNCFPYRIRSLSWRSLSGVLSHWMSFRSRDTGFVMELLPVRSRLPYGLENTVRERSPLEYSSN